MLDKLFSVALVATAGAVAASVAAMKKRNICPVCEVKKAIAKTDVHIRSGSMYDNGVALTPPMGWSSWNAFHGDINEKLILEMADAMRKSGLLEAGYGYVNLDDCWHSSLRDENGRLQGDLTTFPHGIPALVRQLNEKGFKAGIYSSNGTLTCEDLPASLGHERTDAETFAEWGIEYFKYDFCHNVPIPSKAPYIDKLCIGGAGLQEEIVLEAENGELYGDAKIVEDKYGSYITRLDSNLGAVKFSFVSVPETAEYVLTIVLRKNGKTEKYAEITVNGKDKYPIIFPPTRAWSRSGRLQVKIRLQAGDNTIEIRNPIASTMDSAATQYINMGKELKRATKLQAERTGTPEKPIVFSICEWGRNKPWRWGAEAGNLWRTTPDIMPKWASVVGIYEANVRLYKFAGVGAYNDPDMLEVGNGNLTLDENKAHFTLWCMMASPLILGNDLRTFLKPDGSADTSNPVLQILTNKALIAVDQDRKCMPCRRVKTNGLSDVLVKPLENGEIALCLFNKAPKPMHMEASLAKIAGMTFAGLPTSKNYTCTELWDETTLQTADVVSATVPAHGVKVYRVKAE